MDEQIKLSFSTIEKALWNLTLETFQRSLVEILSILDRYLMAKRNKERYEYKERKEKTLITPLVAFIINRCYDNLNIAFYRGAGVTRLRKRFTALTLKPDLDNTSGGIL